jgi:hypothetical protein
MLAAAPKMQASVRLLYQPLPCKLSCSSNPTNRNVTELSLEIPTGCISVTNQYQTHVHMNIFLTITDTITTKNIDLSYGITLCFVIDL